MSVDITREVVAQVFGAVAAFLEKAGCPFTPEQHQALMQAHGEIGTWPEKAAS